MIFIRKTNEKPIKAGKKNNKLEKPGKAREGQSEYATKARRNGGIG